MAWSHCPAPPRLWPRSRRIARPWSRRAQRCWLRPGWPPQVLVTVDRLRRGKPAPDGYLLAAAELGRAAADCLVVEDSASGISAARAAGCAVLAVATTTTANRLAADLVVGTLADVRFTAEAGGVRLSRP